MDFRFMFCSYCKNGEDRRDIIHFNDICVYRIRTFASLKIAFSCTKYVYDGLLILQTTKLRKDQYSKILKHTKMIYSYKNLYKMNINHFYTLYIMRYSLISIWHTLKFEFVWVYENLEFTTCINDASYIYDTCYFVR